MKRRDGWKAERGDDISGGYSEEINKFSYCSHIVYFKSPADLMMASASFAESDPDFSFISLFCCTSVEVKEWQPAAGTEPYGPQRMDSSTIPNKTVLNYTAFHKNF
ncbi:hypothetical protein fugu_003854 [Takifugu bimaculatus]|uniref:Uncharacterized protein n=1 Tax=Takifugu bimaculatus TaxID=433685 RepID=A0A4Z2BEM7_9TELE|nr:hypothetical protein fugu_003854 [Takifugu bimaculatus]